MDIIKRSTNYITITIDEDEIVDTQISSQHTTAKKYFVTSFQGSGILQISDNKENWFTTDREENEAFELHDTLPRYFKIGGTGDEKTVHLITL